MYNLYFLIYDQLNELKVMSTYEERIQILNDKIEAEKALTKIAFEKIEKAKQKREEQMTKSVLKSISNVQRINEIKISLIEAVKKNGVDNVNFVNFAFVGHTKNGKSSLINAIRGLTKDDLDAAGVDVLECTQTIKWYSVPNGKMPNVRFYDVPGSGAMSHKAANYYEDKALCGFDCLVILVQQTLAEEEIKFALAALEYNQKVVFVRSKCDIDFHLKDESGKNLRSIPSSEEIREHINELRFRFNQELRKHATLLRGTKCFFVSSKSLRAKVRNEIPDMNFEESEFLEYLHHESRRIR